MLVYRGDEANMPKRFVSWEKLCLSGTTEYWINDQTGLPLMVITAELNEKLKSENFFRYMIENFDFDRMVEYGTEPVDQKRTIPNPEYNKLTYLLKENQREKSAD